MWRNCAFEAQSWICGVYISHVNKNRRFTLDDFKEELIGRNNKRLSEEMNAL
jgi:hypothetical protein